MADGDDDDEFAVNIREAGPSIPARLAPVRTARAERTWQPCSLSASSGAWPAAAAAAGAREARCTAEASDRAASTGCPAAELI